MFKKFCLGQDFPTATCWKETIARTRHIWRVSQCFSQTMQLKRSHASCLIKAGTFQHSTPFSTLLSIGNTYARKCICSLVASLYPYICMSLKCLMATEIQDFTGLNCHFDSLYGFNELAVYISGPFLVPLRFYSGCLLDRMFKGAVQSLKY